MDILGEDKAVALQRFAGIAKTALTAAGLLTTRDTMVLQAFVLFLVLDLAQRLHYSILTFHSSPFVIIMRRNPCGFLRELLSASANEWDSIESHSWKNSLYLTPSMDDGSSGR
jgi:hypothetical protein